MANSLADAIMKAVNDHDVTALREATKERTIQEVTMALTGDTNPGELPAKLDWQTETVSAMLEVAENSSEGIDSPAVANYMRTLLFSIAFSSEMSSLDTVVGPLDERINRLMTPKMPDGVFETTGSQVL